MNFLKVAAWIAVFSSIVKATFANYIDDSEEIEVWSFRTDVINSTTNSSNAKVVYSGPSFDGHLTDFTICLRFYIHVFHEISHSFIIFRAKSPESKEEMRLEVSGNFANQFTIVDANGNEQTVWFNADAPLQQWISMCFVRNMKEEKFRIYQNDILVYSYNECLTQTSSTAESNIYPGYVYNK